VVLLRLPLLVGVGQVEMLATLVVLHRHAMSARVLHRRVAGLAVMIVVGQRQRAAGVPIGHAAMIVALGPDATTKLALRRMPIGRRGWSTASVLFAN
jgi:hypothetical protein